MSCSNWPLCTSCGHPGSVHDEFAIRDEATGDWFGPFNQWGVPPESALRGSYTGLFGRTAFHHGEVSFRSTARIVPAPRKMTDAEAWEWLHANNALFLIGSGSSRWIVCRLPPPELGLKAVGEGRTPEDAIRSARCVVEKAKCPMTFDAISDAAAVRCVAG